MRGPSVLTAALLLAIPLLAGCSDRAPPVVDPSLSPQPADGPTPVPSPPTTTDAGPSRPVGKAPEGFWECVDLEVRAQPASVDPGRPANVTATLRNACDRDVHVFGADSCTPEAIEAYIEWNGTAYFFTAEGAAADVRRCGENTPSAVKVGARGEYTLSWAWNGTLHRSGTTDVDGEWLALPPGEHALVAYIVYPTSIAEEGARGRIHVGAPPTPG